MVEIGKRRSSWSYIGKGSKRSLWREILSASITTAKELAEFTGLEEKDMSKVISKYPVRVNPYYLSLISRRGDPVYRQCIPDSLEITDSKGLEDPLNEEGDSPVPGLTHRYPDRVLFLISSTCAVYCRFCNRKRKVGRGTTVTERSIREGLRYIRKHREIRDVLLSGGDPLLLENRKIFRILKELRSIDHVEIVRIGTRVPCTLPHRVTPQLAGMLKGFHPVYVLTHFNHPVEITPEASMACERLADAGIPVGCQTVLLKGVNDDPVTMKALMQKLLAIRVRPYYLFQADLAQGTSHFWTPLKTGLKIMESLQGHTSGLGLPHFAVDLPKGGGKVPLLPTYAEKETGQGLLIKNYQGKEYEYPGCGISEGALWPRTL